MGMGASRGPANTRKRRRPAQPVNILITNAFLDFHAGTQVVVRELARELRRQGHDPVVYSPRLGLVADEIRSSGIVVTDRLSSLTKPPDIIHGQHSPSLQALCHFLAVPAIYVCHGVGGEETVFHHPRFLRYVAVDERCRKAIASVAPIPASKIDVIFNAVDLERFQSRSPLPMKPKRALVFSNQASRWTHLPVVRRACRNLGLQLDVVGLHAGNPVAQPESILAGYDIVFAKARCALEALAAGCAVVLCDAMGLGPMVSSQNFESLRSMNFGAGVLLQPLHPKLIREEILRYDPADAAAVSRRVRTEAGLVESTRRWVALYTAVVEEFARFQPDRDEELRALAACFKRPTYNDRVEWERQQLQKLRAIPVIGGALFHSARVILRKWTGRWGLP